MQKRKMRRFAYVPIETFVGIDVGKIKTDIRGANAIKDGIEAPFWLKSRKSCFNWAKTLIE